MATMPAYPDLRGRGVLITGASGLVGGGLARGFAREGARLVLSGRKEAELAAVAGSITADFPAAPPPVVVEADLAVEDQVRALGEAAIREEVEVLLCNAGLVSDGRSFLESDLGYFDRLFSVNVRAAFHLSQLLATHWLTAGVRGRIIVTSSPGSRRAHDRQAVYDGTKGALDALVRSLAVELGPHGIRVNAFAPAAVADPPQAREDAPLRRGTAPAESAAAALFLASEASSAITGHYLPVDAGLLAQLRTPRS